MTDLDLHRRLLKADTDMLNAVIEGPAALDIFLSQYSTLQRDTLDTPGLGEDIIELARESASRVALYAQTFYDLDTAANALECDVAGELEAIFENLTLSDDTPFSTLRATVSETSHCSELLSESIYGWLIKNLHDPYPTAAEKRSIAASSNASVDQASKMFKNARKCVGWTRLQSEHFKGSRDDAIAAATSYFQGPESPITTQLAAEFCAMKARTLSMLNSQNSINRSDRASIFQAVQKLVVGEDDRTREELRSPSQRSSPVPSLTFSSSSDESDVDEVLTVPAVTRKRCASPEPGSCSTEAPRKRSRVNCFSTNQGFSASQIQIVPSDEETCNFIVQENCIISPVKPLELDILSPPDISSRPSRKRKRSSNDEVPEGDVSSKRSCRPLDIPSARSSSDPSSGTVPLDGGFYLQDWVDANINAHSSLIEAGDESDLTSLLDCNVEVFNDWNSLGLFDSTCDVSAGFSQQYKLPESDFSQHSALDLPVYTLQLEGGVLNLEESLCADLETETSPKDPPSNLSESRPRSLTQPQHPLDSLPSQPHLTTEVLDVHSVLFPSRQSYPESYTDRSPSPLSSHIMSPVQTINTDLSQSPLDGLSPIIHQSFLPVDTYDLLPDIFSMIPASPSFKTIWPAHVLSSQCTLPLLYI